MIRRRKGHTSIWLTRRDLRGCYIELNKEDEDLINVALPTGDVNIDGMRLMNVHPMTRQEAKMLAKRITQCLEATKLR